MINLNKITFKNFILLLFFITTSTNSSYAQINLETTNNIICSDKLILKIYNEINKNGFSLDSVGYDNTIIRSFFHIHKVKQPNISNVIKWYFTYKPTKKAALDSVNVHKNDEIAWCWIRHMPTIIIEELNFENKSIADSTYKNNKKLFNPSCFPYYKSYLFNEKIFIIRTFHGYVSDEMKLLIKLIKKKLLS